MQQTRAAIQTLGLLSDDHGSSLAAELVVEFQRVCETHLQAVYAYIRYRVSNTDTAKELTATTFARALQRLETFDPAKGELTSWVFGIARHLVRDHLRTRRRWAWVPIDWLGQRRSEEPNPEIALAAREEQQQVASALARLPDRERDVLGLKFAAALTNREIARMTGLREGHVAVIIFRALQKLRRQLASEGGRRA